MMTLVEAVEAVAQMRSDYAARQRAEMLRRREDDRARRDEARRR
jgi:hypothetical protein